MAFLIRFVLIPLIAILLIRYILRSLGSAGRSGRIMSDETGFACTLFAALGHIAEGRSVTPRERLVRRILGIIAAAESAGGSDRTERISALRSMEDDGALCRALMALYEEGSSEKRGFSLDTGSLRGSRRSQQPHRRHLPLRPLRSPCP